MIIAMNWFNVLYLILCMSQIITIAHSSSLVHDRKSGLAGDDQRFSKDLENAGIIEEFYQ